MLRMPVEAGDKEKKENEGSGGTLSGTSLTFLLGFAGLT